MSDIDVYLTTSKFSLASELDSESFKTFKELDVPVCTTSFCMLLFNSNSQESEKFEHEWAETSRKMARIVRINSEKMIVYIGDEPEDENNALVQYCEENPNKYAKNFFKSWEEIHQMLFEFVVKGKNNETIFCLKGLWNKDKWQFLDILGTSKIEMISENATKRI
jgi:hypothetical protein